MTRNAYDPATDMFVRVVSVNGSDVVVDHPYRGRVVMDAETLKPATAWDARQDRRQD